MPSIGKADFVISPCGKISPGDRNDSMPEPLYFGYNPIRLCCSFEHRNLSIYSTPTSMPLLEIHNLHFSSSGKPILCGVNLAVGESEIHALLGANGTGKSTLAYMIMGCEGFHPDKGDILLAGQRLNRLALHERARQGVTLAWQEPVRFEGIRVKDYLSLCGRAADPEGSLQRVGLVPADYLDRMVDKTLSGGERKRIELASVLTLEPRLVILDEPTSGIDLLSVHEMMDVIFTFKQRGASVLLITHREEVSRMADVASQLSMGRIVYSGDPVEVAARYLARERKSQERTHG